MRAYQLDPASGVRLVGGEMLDWSDTGPGVSAGVSPVVVAALLGGSGAHKRILVLGPRAAGHLDQMRGDAQVDVLVRGLPDARELASTAPLAAGVTVYCGGLDRFTPEGSYDVVVALDAPTTLLTPDSEGAGARELLQLMAKWLAPEGTLVAVLENDLGMERLLRLHVRDDYDSDAAWSTGAPGYDKRPLYFHEVQESLQAAGLVPQALYAAFPAVDDVTMLVSGECVDDAALAASAGALAASVEASAFAHRPSLLDAYDLSLRLFESRQVMALASAWLVVGRSARTVPSEQRADGGPGAASLPALLLTDQAGRPEWGAVRSVARVDGQWTHRLHPVSGLEEMRERRLVRHFAALAADLPVGPSLEAVLRRACSARDVREVRRLVVRYAEWLRAAPDDDLDGDPRFFAVPAKVVLTGDQMASLDLTWRLTERLPHEVLLVRGLRDFSRRLLGSGAEHPWAPDISPDRLAQTLASMAGLELHTQTIDLVARVEAECAVVVAGGGLQRESVLYADNLDAGRSQYVAQAGPSRGYREALATSGRMATSLEDRRNQVMWLEESLRARDRRLADLERQFENMRGSFSFRIGRFLTWPGRAVLQLVRRLAMSAIPHGLVSKAMKLAERVARRV